MSLDTAIEHALKAKRIVAASQSYAKDNPVESRDVFEYLNGGGRPIGVLTEMGLFLLDVEDERRGVDPEPPPPIPGAVLLRDKPPGWPDYVGYQRVAAGGRTYVELRENTVLDLGNHSYPEGIMVDYDKNVVAINWSVTATGSNRAAGVGLSLLGRTASAHFYGERGRIKPTRVNGVWQRTMNDGIATRANCKGRITLQKLLVGPVAVKAGYTSGDAHADILQIQGDFDGDLRVHRFTGYTEYTGVMESEYLVRSQDWLDTNLVASGYSATDLDPIEVDLGQDAHTAFGIYGAGLTKTLPGLRTRNFYWAKDPQTPFIGYDAWGAPYITLGKPRSAIGAEYDYVTDAELLVASGYA